MANTIADIIYLIEQDHIEDLTDHDIIRISRYLIENLKQDHKIPGKTWYTFVGILDWHREHGFITPRQASWLLAHTADYLDQRKTRLEEYL